MIISFYSYKGGTGRTQLCANIAAYLCFEKKLKVLLWDWDLEAPGLHTFFGKKEADVNRPGTLELLESYVTLMRTRRQTKLTVEDLPFFSNGFIAPLQKNSEGGQIDLLQGGNYTQNYAYKVNHFDWFEFTEQFDGAGYIEILKKKLQLLDYDYILIDSRTGITDYAGLCNIQLPDANVLIVTPQEQSFEGNLKIANRIQQAPYIQEGYRKAYILPILSRLDTYQDDKRNTWAEKFTIHFAPYYNTFFNIILSQNPENEVAHRYFQQPKAYNANTSIDYSSELSFGENVLFPNKTERFIDGFMDNVKWIAEILENANKPNHKPSNLLYTDLNKKEVYIGNKQYKGREDFKHSILFLKIEKTTMEHQYALNLYLKTKYLGDGKLGHLGEKLLKNPIQVQLPPQANLKQRLEHYQTLLTLQVNGATRVAFISEFAANLFNSFFNEDLSNVFFQFTQSLENKHIHRLLLVMATDEIELLAYPFEIALPSFFAFQTQQAKQFLTHLDFGFARTTAVTPADFDLAPHHKVYLPLKMLFVAALPENLEEHLPATEVETLVMTQYQLMDALENISVYTPDAPAEKPKLWIEYLYPATLAEIENALRRQSYDIIHLSAYSTCREGTKTPVLYLENEQGDLSVFSGTALCNILAPYSTLKLLILNLLQTNSSLETHPIEAEIATVLPAVITTRFRQADEEMMLFTTTFYETLLKKGSLTQALHTAKERLFQDSTEKKHQETSIQAFAAALPITTYLNQFGETFWERGNGYQMSKSLHSLQELTPTHLIGGSFIGRKRLLIQMQQIFRRGQHICLHGLGGLGKTTLAEAFIHQYAMQEKAAILVFRSKNQINERYILENLNHRFESVRPDLAKGIQQLLDASQMDSLDKLQTLINNYPKKAKLILFFDNCEEIQKGDKEVDYLQQRVHSPSLSNFLRHMCLHAPKNCHLLFATRYQMNDLADVLTHVALVKMSALEQNQLLNQSPVLRKIPVEERATLYKQFDGHPHSYIYLESLLKQDATFQWSQVESVQKKVSDKLLLGEVYERLSVEEQKIFQWVAAFKTHTHLLVLAGVLKTHTTKELLPHLLTFQAWSLCHFEERTQTFSVHHITRDWMKRKLITTLEKVDRKRIHLKIGNYILANLVGEIQDFRNINIDYVLLAKDYFEDADELGLEAFANLSFRLHHYYYTMGLYENATQLNTAVLEKNINPITNSDALNNKGVIDYVLGKYPKAFEHLQKSLEIRATAQDAARLAESYTNISLLYKFHGNYKTAMECLNKSLAIQRKKGDTKIGIDIIYNNKSQVYVARRFFKRAKTCLNRCLEIQQQQQNKKGEANTYINLANLEYLVQKNYDSGVSLGFLEKALSLQKNMGAHYEAVNTLENIGIIHTINHSWVEAIKTYLEASAILQTNGLQGSAKEKTILKQLEQLNQTIGQLAFEQILNEVVTGSRILVIKP